MIGSHHCPHSVRDNQNCLILEQRGERSLEAGFVLYIQRGGRLVQQNNGGVFQQGAGNRNTLAFTPGQSRAIFAHHRQVSLRQTLNKVIALGGPGCGHNLLICGVLAAQTDISHDGIVEQHHILEHNGIVLQQCFRVHRGDVHAAHSNAAFLNVPKAGGQLRCGALTASRGSDQCGHLALLGGEGHIGQHILTVLIPEAHMVKANIVTFGLILHCAFLCWLLFNGFHAAELEHCIEDLTELHHHTAEWVINAGSCHQEHEEKE